MTEQMGVYQRFTCIKCKKTFWDEADCYLHVSKEKHHKFTRTQIQEVYFE